jgi:hypothetical protein
MVLTGHPKLDAIAWISPYQACEVNGRVPHRGELISVRFTGWRRRRAS